MLGGGEPLHAITPEPGVGTRRCGTRTQMQIIAARGCGIPPLRKKRARMGHPAFVLAGALFV